MKCNGSLEALTISAVLLIRIKEWVLDVPSRESGLAERDEPQRGAADPRFERRAPRRCTITHAAVRAVRAAARLER